jgi:hypothetical protein
VTWLRIAGAPARNLYRNSPDALPAKEAKHGILIGLSELRSTTDAENANITASLSNDSGEASALFSAAPPIGAQAEIRDASGTMFAGVVRAISLSAAGAEIEVEA